MARVARTLMRMVVVVVLAGFLVAASLVALGYSSTSLAHNVATAKEVPMPDLETAAQVPSVIYAANGEVLATLRSTLNRQPVKLSQVAPILVHAVLDTEDHGFYLHGGVDIEAIIRALLADVNAGSAVQGGSTIAQELVKNTYLTDQKTLTRKIREAVLAERLEEKYSKDQILDAYLNTVYLGNGAYGVEAAAKEYFGRDADQVDLAQAALLAGLLQAPSGYDPLVNPVGARFRRGQVLARMAHYGTITAAQEATANQTPLPTSVHDAPGISYTTKGYYVEQVVDELLDNPDLGTTRQQREHALFGGGLKIYTNEDPALQTYAQNIAVADIPAALPGVVAAFAVVNPRNGNVEALVGGPSADENEYDDATQGELPPGSGFKLFTLLAALEEGYSVYDSILATSPCAVLFPGVPEADGYNPEHPMQNDPGDPNGVVSLVNATANSINCAFLRLAHEVTLDKVVGVAHSLGLAEHFSDVQPSLVLGPTGVTPVEMADAYATVADLGVYHPPTFVNRIVDLSGATIYNGETSGKRVFPTLVAEEALVALQATVQYGTGTKAAIPNVDVAGKTGTTQDSKDIWFNGITPTFAASVWMGYPRVQSPLYVSWDGGLCTAPVALKPDDCQELFGADYPTEIWQAVASHALEGSHPVAFPAPDYSLLPPQKYIDSLGLEHDDLFSHGAFPVGCGPNGNGLPCPTTTTTTPQPKAPVKTTVGPASPNEQPTRPTTSSEPPTIRRAHP
jgi:penicillin-binding protein 1A